MKSNKLPVGVRYCGGCNPRYDRVAAVKRLEELHPHRSFTAAEAARPYAAVVVACGCPSRCVETRDLMACGPLIALNGWEGTREVEEQLDLALQGAD